MTTTWVLDQRSQVWHRPRQVIGTEAIGQTRVHRATTACGTEATYQRFEAMPKPPPRDCCEDCKATVRRRSA